MNKLAMNKYVEKVLAEDMHSNMGLSQAEIDKVVDKIVKAFYPESDKDKTVEYLTKRIESLGYELVVQHFRYDKTGKYTKDSAKFSGLGGQTLATILDDKGWTVCMGMSRCSTKDNFQKRIGWVKAVGRAISFVNKIGDVSNHHSPDSFGPNHRTKRNHPQNLRNKYLNEI